MSRRALRTCVVLCAFYAGAVYGKLATDMPAVHWNDFFWALFFGLCFFLASETSPEQPSGRDG